MSHPTHISLEVVRVDVAQAHLDKKKLYIVIKRGDNQNGHKTGKLQEDGRPVSNAIIPLPAVSASGAPTAARSPQGSSASYAPTALNIILKISRRLRKSKHIGHLNIEVQTLLQEVIRREGKCRADPGTHGEFDGIIQHDFTGRSGNNASAPVGNISLRIKGIDAVTRGRIFVEIAEHDAERIGTSLEKIDSTIGTIIQVVDRIVQIVDTVAEIHPLFNLAWKVTKGLYEIVSIHFATDAKLKELVRKMSEAFDCSSQAGRLNDRREHLKLVVGDLRDATVECSRFVQKYTSRNLAARTINSQDSNQTMDGFISLFGGLKKRLDSAIGLATFEVVLEIESRQLRTESRELLERVLEMKMEKSKLSTRPRCLEGTRKEYIDEIKAKLFPEGEGGEKIVWLRGAAGTGKSTIAATIADECDNEGSPAVYLFFERDKGEYRSAIRSIAYQLAVNHPPIAPYIVKAVEANPNISGSPLKTQFEKLLLDPLRGVGPELKRPIFIVLDALDECGTSDDRRELVQLLNDNFAKLPPKVRLLVTSRPEKDITSLLSFASHVFHIELEHTSSTGREDVGHYIRKEVTDAVEGQVSGELEWEDVFRKLIRAADGLFIWASTVVKMIRISDDPVGKLETLAGNIQLVGAGIDGLYATALRESGISWLERESQDRFRKIMGLVLFGKEAFSDVEIAALLDIDVHKVGLTLGRLRSVLSYEPGRPVRLHHASFADYILSSERSGGKAWNVDEPSQRQALAGRCFGVMTDDLRFNICNVESSFVRNEDVPGLEDRIETEIPPRLHYACRFWATHFCDLAHPSAVLDKLKAFAHSGLLYWLEVLSLTKYFNRVAGRALRDVCVKIVSIDSELSSFLWAAYRMVVAFAYPISQSAPQIYLSAVSLWKSESHVADRFWNEHPVVRARRFGTKTPAQCMKVLQGHTNWVSSISFSPNGQRVASGSADGTVRIWDADSGEVVAGPFKGHTGGVTSVAFSPDGRRIASGSEDTSVRIWDADSGELIIGPFEGHTSAVYSVAFSPDGRRVASGSWDHTVRIWDADSGELVVSPFEGHTGGVWSVVFSPDGRRVASGSADNTVRIWDADSGGLVVGPLEGHMSAVYSVAFSPDGHRIASGSDDKTVQIWDADSGELVVGPLQDRACAVWSVAFSPDGRRVASGSDDKTVRIWDADSGELVVGAFEGHTSSVYSVAFSPDGRRVASGSWDETVRIWDADSGELADDPFKGHTESVTSVAFSPNGRRVASGSEDKTVRIWDANSGELVVGPFKGHTGRVWLVAFSPDGRRVASGSDDSTVRIWDADSGEPVIGPFEGHTGPVYSVAFSPDGRRIASGSEDNTVRIWDADSGKLVLGPFRGRTSAVWSVAFSPDGRRVVAGSSDSTVHVWDAVSGDHVVGPFKGITAAVWSVAFSPDGRRIASGSEDETVCIWDADSGERIIDPFEGHTETVRSVAFSPDGRRVASGSGDKTVRIWDANGGEVVFGPFKGHTGTVNSVAFSQDGRHAVSGSGDRTIRVWEMREDDRVPARSKHSGGNTSSNLPLPLFHSTFPEPFKPEGSGRSNARIVSDWTLSEDGWVLGAGGELLTWIPEEMRGTLWRSRSTVVCSCQFSTKLDLLSSPLGEDWCKDFPYQNKRNVAP